MERINIKNKGIEDMVSELYNIPYREVGDHPLVQQINHLSMEYLDKKIGEAYGDNYVMGCATGGFSYNIECEQLVKQFENGDEEYIDLK
jgi:hypothetical protein